MEIVPKQNKISINWNALSTGSDSLDSSNRDLAKVRDELLKVNEAVLAELTGDLKNTFFAAGERTGDVLGSVCGMLHNVSETVYDLREYTTNINLNAETQAGGKTNG